MRLTQDTINRIIMLRKHGYSIPEISGKCQLSKSTVFRYIKGIDILPNHYERWLERRNASKIIAERNWTYARKKAEQLISGLTKKELTLIGASLYWAEGSKRDFCLTNTDPEMIRIFIYILRAIFLVNDSDLVISLRIYEDLDKTACLVHWSEITGINLMNGISVDVLNGSKKGKLKYGMCRVRVKKGGFLLKQFRSIIERVGAELGPRSSMDRTKDS